MKWTTLWVDDYMTGTGPLEPDARGVFVTLVCYFISKDCAIPDNDQYISRLCNTTVYGYRKIKKVLVAGDFITIKDGCIWIERSAKQWEKDEVFSKKQSEKAKKRHAIAKAKLLKPLSIDSAGADAGAYAGGDALPTPTPTPTPTPEEVKDIGKPMSKKPRKKPAIDFPENWTPNPKAFEIGSEQGYSGNEVRQIASTFEDTCKSKGTQYVDWDRAFYKWLRSGYTKNDVEAFRRKNGNGNGFNRGNAGQAGINDTNAALASVFDGQSMGNVQELDPVNGGSEWGNDEIIDGMAEPVGPFD